MYDAGWAGLCQIASCVPYWSLLAKLICLPRSSSSFIFRHQCGHRLQRSTKLSLVWSSGGNSFKHIYKHCIRYRVMLAPGFGDKGYDTSDFEVHCCLLGWLRYSQEVTPSLVVLSSPISILCPVTVRFSNRSLSINAASKNKSCGWKEASVLFHVFMQSLVDF